jgi:hypothetical protein
VAAGTDGIEVVDLARQERRRLLPPDAPADRIDDLAIADGWLFALDATPPGHLMTYSLANPDLPSPAGEVVPVPVGPFSGVSAAAGVVAVSGGTSQLTLREYDRDGRFGTEVVTADFGRGQPDVALRPDGRAAAISTHLYGPEFAITFAEIRRRPLRWQALGQLELRDAGFTPGGFKPAHFPLVAAWRGDRVYLADGGGLAVVDASDLRQPHLLARDRQPQPAMDVVVSGGELDVVRAGSQPAVFRYRLDDAGLPTPVGTWSLPAGSHPAGIARDGADALITQHERGWQTVPPSSFSPFPPTNPDAPTQRSNTMQRQAALLIVTMLTVLGVGACKPQSPEPEAASTPAATTEAAAPAGAAMQAGPATYRIELTPLWTKANFPLEYPDTSLIHRPHFSGLIGTAHNANYQIVRDGQMPSPGLERLSEEGKHNPLDEEINAAIAAGNAVALTESDPLKDFSQTATAEVMVGDAHPMVSLVAMIAPSPDWFAAVTDVNLMENGAWLAGKTVDAMAWDSGGDDGTTYLADDKDTNPKKPTSMNKSRHFMKDGQPMPVARITFTRM